MVELVVEGVIGTAGCGAGYRWSWAPLVAGAEEAAEAPEGAQEGAAEEAPEGAAEAPRGGREEELCLRLRHEDDPWFWLDARLAAAPPHAVRGVRGRDRGGGEARAAWEEPGGPAGPQGQGQSRRLRVTSQFGTLHVVALRSVPHAVCN